MENKLVTFLRAAKEFTDRIKLLDSVDEVAIFGSVAGGDQYPSDVDVAVFLNSMADIPQIARVKREIDNANALDIFVFNQRRFIGNVCHRKNCPAKSVECAQPGCGDVKFVRIREGLTPDLVRWFKTPVEVLHKRGDKSILLSWQKDILQNLGLTIPELYPVREGVIEKCRECGDKFEIDPGEQKYFESMGFDLPKRCQRCRDERNSGSLGDADD